MGFGQLWVLTLYFIDFERVGSSNATLPTQATGWGAWVAPPGPKAAHCQPNDPPLLVERPKVSAAARTAGSPGSGSTSYQQYLGGAGETRPAYRSDDDPRALVLSNVPNQGAGGFQFLWTVRPGLVVHADPSCAALAGLGQQWLGSTTLPAWKEGRCKAAALGQSQVPTTQVGQGRQRRWQADSKGRRQAKRWSTYGAHHGHATDPTPAWAAQCAEWSGHGAGGCVECGHGPPAAGCSLEQKQGRPPSGSPRAAGYAGGRGHQEPRQELAQACGYSECGEKAAKADPHQQARLHPGMGLLCGQCLPNVAAAAGGKRQDLGHLRRLRSPMGSTAQRSNQADRPLSFRTWFPWPDRCRCHGRRRSGRARGHGRRAREAGRAETAGSRDDEGCRGEDHGQPPRGECRRGSAGGSPGQGGPREVAKEEIRQGQARCSQHSGRCQSCWQSGGHQAPSVGSTQRHLGSVERHGQPTDGRCQVLSHSVKAEWDYTSPWLATYLGRRCQYEVHIEALGICSELQLDARQRQHGDAYWQVQLEPLSHNDKFPLTLCCDPVKGASRNFPDLFRWSSAFQAGPPRMAPEDGIPDVADRPEKVSEMMFSSHHLRPALLSGDVQDQSRHCTKRRRHVTFSEEVACWSFRSTDRLKHHQRRAPSCCLQSARCWHVCHATPTSPQIQCPDHTIMLPEPVAPDGTPERKVSRGPEPRSPSQIALIQAEQVRIVPEELRRVPIFTKPVVDFDWGRAAGEAVSTYTVFDHVRHSRVARKLPQASLLEIAALAMNEAPFAVAAIKVLADPLPGFPAPQLVLVERGRPADELPVPWDLRRFNEPVRTLRHHSREDRASALHKVERLLIRHRPITQEVEAGTVIVTDAVGVLMDVLPANLHVIQHYRVAEHRPPPDTDNQAATAEAQADTTSTTTAVRVIPTVQQRPCLRLAVLRGAVVHSIEIGDRTTLLDPFLFDLLERHHRDAPLPATFGLILASAQPPVMGYHQEALVLLVEDAGRATVCWDGRASGSPLQTCAVDEFHRLQLLLSADWQRQGWTIAVNGINVAHVARNARDGDFIQPFQGMQTPPATPLSWVLEGLPALQPLAWRLTLSLDRVQFYRSLRHRRQQLGFHFFNVGIVRLCGPTHGDLRIRTGRFDEPELAHANQAVGRLGQFPQQLQIWDTPVARDHSALFVSDAPNSHLGTVLVPAPGFAGHYFVMLASRHLQELAGLPALPHHTLAPRRGFRHGDVLLALPAHDTPDPESSRIEAEESTLLQLTHGSGRALRKLASVTTPFGRRSVPLPPAHAPTVQQSGGDPNPVASSAPATRRPPATLDLEACLPIAHQGQTEDKLRIGLPKDAVDLALGGFHVSHYCKIKPHAACEHPAARRFLCDLPVAGDSNQPSALIFLIDGSYEHGAGAWAVCLLGLFGNTWCWIGFLADRIQPIHTVASAFEPELYAQFVALGTTARMGVPAAILFDSTSAAATAQATAPTCADKPLCRAAASLYLYLTTRRLAPAMLHVRAHQGHGANELADGVAKRALRSVHGRAPHGDSSVDQYIIEQAFDNLWLHTAASASREWPVFDEDGDSCAVAVPPANPVPLCPQAWSRNQPAKPTSAVVRFGVATYNTLSAKSALQRACLSSFMQAEKLAVLGLQECRQQVERRTLVGSCTRLAGPTEDGRLGCQLWLSNHPQYGWDLNSLSVVAASPRLLTAQAKSGQVTYTLVAGHCPVSAAPAETRALWWAELRDRLARRPPRSVPLLFLDANAHFEWVAGAECATNANAHELESLLVDFQLQRTSAFEKDGAPRLSWHPPPGAGAAGRCLDYVVWPLDWSGQDCGLAPLADVHAGIDHEPVKLIIQAEVVSRCKPPCRLDVFAMRSEAGKAKLHSIFDSIPPAPWHWDADRHVEHVNWHIQQGLRQHFRAETQGPRKPCLSDTTWRLIQDRREQRRLFRRQRSGYDRWVLSQCFLAWRGRSPDSRQIARIRARVVTFARIAAYHAVRMRHLTQQMREAHMADEAAFTRARFTEARHLGPAALAKQIRVVLRSGRQQFQPGLPAHLQTPHGVASSPGDVLAAFGEHFAIAEQATPVGLAQVPRDPHEEAPGACCLEGAPALADLAAAFASLKRGKAPGLSQIPPDAYRGAAAQAAVLHYPLVLKILARRRMPLLWTGLLARPIPKSNKPRDQVTGWRSIALVEPAAKAVVKATRPVLARGFESQTLATCGGARKGHPTEVPAMSVAAHIRGLRSRNQNGSILFIDAISAFYAVRRSHLFTDQVADMRSYLAGLPLQDEVRARLQQALGEVGALERAGVPAASRRIVRAAMQSTWFCTDPGQSQVFHTSQGTMPGSPVADILFQFIGATAIACLADHLRDLGIAASVSTAGPAIEALPVSWLDDVTLLLSSPSPERVAPDTIQAAELSAQYFLAAGVELNFSPGKSEAIPHWCGPGSTKARRAVMLEQAGRLCIQAPDGSSRALHCVHSYVHLGTVRTVDARVGPDIQRRVQLTREVYRPFRNRILRNPHLDIAERQTLFASMILARLMHGVGTWTFSTKNSWELFQGQYMALVRGAIRPLWRLPSTRLNPPQACSLLRVLLPAEAVAVCRVRTLEQLLRRADHYIWANLDHEGQWLAEVQQDVGLIGERLRDAQLIQFAPGRSA